jgi:hypothetical protein
VFVHHAGKSPPTPRSPREGEADPADEAQKKERPVAGREKGVEEVVEDPDVVSVAAVKMA